LLPPIPQRLLRIDETTVGDHFRLAASDTCFYVWEYAAGRHYDFSPTNHLISNLKIKPSQVAARPRRGRYKEQAIHHCAAALRGLIQASWVERIGTFVPMPTSKIPGHEDCDDRIQRLLSAAFHALDADIRPLLEQTESTPADHESPDRLSYAVLRAITRIDESHAAHPPRATIAVIDDVLNSGKHFKIAQGLLAQRFPGIPVIGIFVARCIHSHPLPGHPLAD
jgi:hypothetical protein